MRDSLGQTLQPTPTPSFDAWLRATAPRLNWDWPYIRHIREHLDAVTRGEIKRLLIFAPPRHGKSTTTTIYYPAYRLVRDPRTRVAVACYNQDFAQSFSKRIRTIAREAGVAIDPERRAVEDWLTTRGGGLKAAGVGGGLTGRGFDLILLDDPIKSREEANSASYRERVWDWYKEDVYTRLEPGSAMVIILTRWHTDDLAGRILASERAAEWTVVRLPAIAEAGDPLGRAPGEALCPDRYPLSALADLRATLFEWNFTALFQQRPLPASGALFKMPDEGVPIIAALPEGLGVTARVRRWDVAASAGAGDYSVGVRMAALANGKYLIEDVVRGQWASHERNYQMRAAADADRAWGHVPQIVPQDPGAAGKDMAAALVALLSGHSARAVRESGDKAMRADPLASQWNAGNIWLREAPWNAALIEEFRTFPFGAHDDIVDAASGAFSALASPGEFAVATVTPGESAAARHPAQADPGNPIAGILAALARARAGEPPDDAATAHDEDDDACVAVAGPLPDTPLGLLAHTLGHRR